MLRSLLHLSSESLHFAISWMGTTLLAVIVAIAPFLWRSILAFRRGGWPEMKRNVGSTSLYTMRIWAVLYLVGVVRFVYGDHNLLTAQNRTLQAKKVNL
jgi:hypothetical protein